MAKFYQPPFKMSDEIVNLMIEIGEYVGRLEAYGEVSLADSRRGVPPLGEEENKPTFKNVGRFRIKGAGIYAGGRLIHAATAPQYVERRMQELLTWLDRTTMHPLLKACIFYYEYVFIHPFNENNDAIGQQWFLNILQEWQPFLGELPVDNLLAGREADYYKVLKASKNGDSAVFAAFMLEIIRDELKERAGKYPERHGEYKNVGENNELDVGIKKCVQSRSNEDKVLELLEENPRITAKGLAEQIGLTDRQIERILAKLKKDGRIERIGASKNGYWKTL